MALVVDKVAQRGNIMLVTVLAFQLPGAIVLRILPAAVELVDLLLIFRLYLFTGKNGVNYMQIFVEKTL